MMRRILAGLALTLGACSVLPEKPPVALFDLSPPSGDAAADALPLRLAVARPQASGPLASSWILVRPGGGQIEVYPGAQWSEPLPGLVGTVLIEALEADGRIASVERAAAGLARDLELATELRDFQIETTEGAVAVVRLKASLIDPARGEVVASRLFESRQPAAGREVSAAVAALDLALQRVLSELSDWVVASRPAASGAD